MRSEHQLVRLPPPSFWLRLLAKSVGLKLLYGVTETRFGWLVLTSTSPRFCVTPICERICQGEEKMSVIVAETAEGVYGYPSPGGVVGSLSLSRWRGKGRAGTEEQHDMTQARMSVWEKPKLDPSFISSSWNSLLHHTVACSTFRHPDDLRVHNALLVVQSFGGMCHFPHWHRDSQGQPWCCVSLVKSCSSYGPNRSSLKWALDLERRGTSHSRAS